MSSGRHPDTLVPRAVLRALEESQALLETAGRINDAGGGSLAVAGSIDSTRKELGIAIKRARFLCKGTDLLTADQPGLF